MPTIFEITGVPRRVLDLGGGLHPFALPWMNVPVTSEYVVWEIDQRMVDLVNRFFSTVGRRPLARCQDMLVRTPKEEADVVFLMRVLPSLEQQDKGCSMELLFFR